MPTNRASSPAVAFAVLLAGVICVAVGLAIAVRVYSAGGGPSVEGALGLIFFITGLVVSFDRLKRDIVAAILAEHPRDRDDGSASPLRAGANDSVAR
jgi:hypothetical protein